MAFPGDSGAPEPDDAFGGRPRCGIHGIALNDELDCVLCKRANGSERSWGGVARAAIVLGAALAAYLFVHRMTTDPLLPTAVVVATPASTAEVAPPGDATSSGDDTADPLLPSHHGPAPATNRRPVRMPRRIGSLDSPSPRAPRRVSEVAIEAEMHHVPIVMYATGWCPYCAQARKWLRSNGYQYAERDVDNDESAKEARDRLVPSGGVPVFTVGSAVVNGFSPGGLESALRRQAERSLKR